MVDSERHFEPQGSVKPQINLSRWTLFRVPLVESQRGWGGWRLALQPLPVRGKLQGFVARGREELRAKAMYAYDTPGY